MWATQICCELHRATLKTINQAIKECAKAAIDAAVAACEVSRLLSAAVHAVRAAQVERDQVARDEAVKKRREADEQAQRAADGDDEPTDDEKKQEQQRKEEAQKESEDTKEDEPLPSDPTLLEKKLHVMLRVKNTLLLKEVRCVCVSSAEPAVGYTTLSPGKLLLERSVPLLSALPVSSD